MGERQLWTGRIAVWGVRIGVKLNTIMQYIKFYFQKNLKVSLNLILFNIFYTLCMSSVFADGGYWFDLYCTSSDGKTLSTVCRPATEGQWEIYGGTYNWRYSTPRFGTVDEVSRDMERYIDEKYSYCMPTSVAPVGPVITGTDSNGLISYGFEMAITVGTKDMSNGNCEPVTGNTGSYSHEKRFFCEKNAQGPYKTDAGNRFCAYRQEFIIEISGPSETQALPSYAGPIMQTVRVMGEEGPAKKWGVSIKMIDSNSKVSYIVGTTDDNGIYNFNYVPPYFRGDRVELVASCSQCKNTSDKIISISPIEHEMCRR